MNSPDLTSPMRPKVFRPPVSAVAPQRAHQRPAMAFGALVLSAVAAALLVTILPVSHRETNVRILSAPVGQPLQKLAPAAGGTVTATQDPETGTIVIEDRDNSIVGQLAHMPDGKTAAVETTPVPPTRLAERQAGGKELLSIINKY